MISFEEEVFFTYHFIYCIAVLRAVQNFGKREGVAHKMANATSEYSQRSLLSLVSSRFCRGSQRKSCRQLWSVEAFFQSVIRSEYLSVRAQCGRSNRRVLKGNGGR